MINKKRSICIVLTIFMAACFLPSYTFADNIEQGGSFYKITGHVEPDFMHGKTTASKNKAGFKVEVPNTGLYTTTDMNGYYELNIPVGQSVYSIKVSKSNYLEREIKSLVVSKDDYGYTSQKPEIEYINAPITSDSVIDGIIMWPGDIKVNGLQDNAINLIDIMETAKHFNSSSGSEKYSEDADLNCDNSINMIDIMLIAKHFNKSKKDYLDTLSMAKTIENAISNYCTETGDYGLLYTGSAFCNMLISSLQGQVYINGKTYGPYLDQSEIYKPAYMEINGKCTVRGWHMFIDRQEKLFCVVPNSSGDELAIS